MTAKQFKQLEPGDVVSVVYYGERLDAVLIRKDELKGAAWRDVSGDYALLSVKCSRFGDLDGRGTSTIGRWRENISERRS